MSKKMVLQCLLAPLVTLAVQQSCDAQQRAKPVAIHQAHSTHGPHGGELLEIGKNEFHAELVVDEAKKQVTVYVLEADAKTSLSIESPFLTVNFVLNGKPMQVQLKASPVEIDPKEQSSRFIAASPEMLDALHSTKAEPKLAIRIRNKSYVTKIVHKHDHAGHNHAQQPNANPSRKR